MDNNRNQRSSYRSNLDWETENQSDRNENYWENRNSGTSRQMSSNMGDTDYNSRFGRQGEGNQWNRDSGYNRSDYGRYNSDSGRYNSDYNTNQNSGNYGDRGWSQERNYGYGGREYGSNYGGGNYQGNSSYWDSGSYGNSDRSSYGSGRNLYDRDYENFNRSEGNRMGSSSRIGGSNYGGFENRDRERRGYEEYPFYGSTNMRNYGSSGYGNYYGRSRNWERDNDRNWWDRTKDEVASWFGDEDAERRRERDMRNSHRGRGPKNYTRSDERIKEDINDRLSDDPWVDASEIEVTVSTGEVTLTGTVTDRSDKRRAEDLAEAVSGVKNVENRIRVSQSNTSNMGGTGSYATTSGTTTSATQTGTTGAGSTTMTNDKKQNKSSFVTG